MPLREILHDIILGLEYLWEVQFNAFNWKRPFSLDYLTRRHGRGRSIRNVVDM